MTNIVSLFWNFPGVSQSQIAIEHINVIKSRQSINLVTEKKRFIVIIYMNVIRLALQECHSDTADEQARSAC